MTEEDVPRQEPREGEEEAERPRPRVVDKRISARIARGEDLSGAAGAPKPSAPLDTAGPEPPTVPETPPQPTGAQPAEREETPATTDVAGPEQPDPQARGDRSEVWTPEQEAEAMRIAQDIAQIPSQEWVAQAAVSLANVAGTKLELGQTADAQLSIDALAGLLNSVGSRLGAAESILRQTLAQLQIAYAQSAAPPPPQTNP